MKKDMRAVFVGVVLQFAAVSPLLVYGNIALAEHHEGMMAEGMMAMETKADHEKVAAMYQDEANLLQDKIAQHERMQKGYQAKGGKFGGPSMVNHCKSIVANYNAAIKDNLALAKHHHDMAAAAKE